MEKGMPMGDDSLRLVPEEDLGSLRTEAQPPHHITKSDSSQTFSPHSNRIIYAYNPLPDGYIRVAELCPGQSNDDIVIKLHVQLSKPHKAPVYEALSYVWGSKFATSWVRVVGAIDSELQVTRNLDVALRHLRYTDRARFLWVDAICINQLDDEEKGPQVAMMGKIFRLAARVIAWLGPEENRSDRAMAWIGYMGSQAEYGDTTGLIPSPGAHDVSIGDSTVFLPLEAYDLSYLCHLLYRPWFERLWVRQEIILANENAIVLCGSFVVPWKRFRHGCACVYFKGRKRFEGNDQIFARLGALNSLVFVSRLGLPFHEVQRLFGALKCEDQRDRVYGILALLNRRDLSYLDVKPDYTKSAAEVYEDLVTQYISRAPDLNILTECHFPGLLEGPSWRLRWSWDTSTAPDYSLRNTITFASGHFSAPSTAIIAGELKVWGVSVGRIQRLRESRAGKQWSSKDIVAAIRDAFFFPPRLVTSEYIAGGSLLEACTRTLCRDIFHDSFSPVWKRVSERFTSAELLEKLLYHTPLASGPGLNAFLRAARATLQGNCVYETEEGFIGIAPLGAKIGDQICPILGCDVPLVLRQVDGGKYILVGACYACGVGVGEAMLGPLPNHIRHVQVRSDDKKTYSRVFFNDEIGTQSLADPRIKDWTINHEEYHQRLKETVRPLSLDPEDFRANGVVIQSFTLI